MTGSEIVSSVIALASAIAAILAWTAKIRWSKEYRTAKEAQIEAKEAQIDQLKNEVQSLKEMTPMRIREYFISTKEQHEEIIDDLTNKLVRAKTIIVIKNKKIESLNSEGKQKTEEIRIIEQERDIIQQAVDKFEKQFHEQEAKQTTGNTIADLYSDTIANTNYDYSKLYGTIINTSTINFAELYHLGEMLGEIIDSSSTINTTTNHNEEGSSSHCSQE